MGQYYIPTFIFDSGDIRTLYSHDFDNGLKLMEHSYIGNEFVNAALILIQDQPLQIAWIGDYSDDPYEDLYAQAIPKSEFMRYYEAAWGEERKSKKHLIPPHEFDNRQLQSICTLRTDRKYIVNHSKRQYIHLGAYIARNQWLEKGCYVEGKYHENEEYFMCVHPLPLLTACGNDRGGGDYHSEYPDYDMVGLWAFDLIEYTKTTPLGYDEVMFGFSEKAETPPILAELPDVV